MARTHGWMRHVRAGLVACTALAGLLALPGAARAEPFALAPQTKLRVTVVQWMAAKGEYQQWGPVSGEFTISAEGTLTLPLIGTLAVGDLDSAALAGRIAEQLKDRTGLLSLPNATVEILEYPPIYIVGSVTAPGEYKYRPGLTVLQALALSGGRYRATTEGGDKGQIGMLGDLQGFREEILRALARIARLRAESAGAKEIQFPAELTASANDKVAGEVMTQERIVFEARRSGLARQLESLSELRNLFAAEIGILEKKTEALDGRIKLVSDELANIKSLVERGIATVSRRSELELAVSNLQSNRLDEITATMRARQNLSEATRNALSLRDKYQTDVSTELQEAQANLDRLTIKEDVVKKVLMVSDPPGPGQPPRGDVAEPSLAFTIVRRTPDRTETFAAAEDTPLMPRDVVKVTLGEPARQQAKSTHQTNATQ